MSVLALPFTPEQLAWLQGTFVCAVTPTTNASDPPTTTASAPGSSGTTPTDSGEVAKVFR